MGLFDWLLGRGDKDPAAEHIWLNRAGKLKGVSRGIAQSLQTGVPVIVAAYFPATLADFRGMLANTSLPFDAADGVMFPPDVVRWMRDRADARVLLGLLPSDTESESSGNPADRDVSSPIDLLVLERHPLPSVDRRTRAFVDQLPFTTEVAYHVSLDDAVLRQFAGGSVRQLLEQLGMSEDEDIESAMVSRRFASARKRIEQQSTGNQAAHSPEEWLRLNCPSYAG